ATVIWNAASGTDTNWSNGGNWTGGIAPTNTDDVKFFDTGTNLPPGTPNNLVDAAFAGTVASLQYGNTNGSHTTVIASGATLTIGSGNFVMGTPGDVGAARAITNTITGAGGTLSFTNPSGVLSLAQGTATGVNLSRSVLNLSGLDT